MSQGGETRPSILRGKSFLTEIATTSPRYVEPMGGGKTITMFAGVALLINNITGPGVPSIPNMFAEAGWLFPTLCFIAIWVMSSMSTTMFCETMRMIPGNEHFRDRVEYTSLVRYFFGDRMYHAAQIGLNGALQSLNVISVIQSAQVMDAAISVIFGKSCGINVTPFHLTYNGMTLPESTKGWSCIDANNFDNGNAWGCHMVVSVGFLLAIVITLPMGYWNLDDNMVIQVGAFVLTIMCWLVWLIACFFSDDWEWSLPAVSEQSQPWASQAGVLGTILFNFGFVTTVPSWVNEKRAEVSVNKSVWLSTFLCNVVFFAIGIPGALAFKNRLQGPATGVCRDGDNCADSMLSIFTTPEWIPSTLHENKAGNFIVQLSVYLFPIVSVLSSIPVFSIVVKYNCIENGWSSRAANFWGILAPWLIAVPLLYQPDALNQFITYSSLIFVSFTDFVVPWCLYIYLMRYGGVNENSPLLRPSCDEEEDGMDEEAQVQAKDVTEGFFENIVEHYAFPQSWGLSSKTKERVSMVLVVIMASVAVAGVVMSIQQGATNSWNCAAVGS